MPPPRPDGQPPDDLPGGEPLPALASRLGYLLKHAQLRLAELTGAAMAPFGVTGRECAVLIAVNSQAPALAAGGRRLAGQPDHDGRL